MHMGGTSDPLSRCVNKSNKSKCIGNDVIRLLANEMSVRAL